MNNDNRAPQGPNQQGQSGWGPHGQQQRHGQPQMTPQQQARQQKIYEQAQKKANRPIWKKKRFIVPVAGVLLIGACSAFTAGMVAAEPSAVPSATSDSASKAPKSNREPKKTAEAPTEPNLAKIGDTVSAGGWAFTVTKFKCGLDKVGDEYLDKSAQGQFCKMNIEVKNDGNQQETLNDSNQKLFDADGREFSSDSEASLYADPDSALFLEGVNPGNTAKGVIIFDVPGDAEIVKAELVGGLFGFDDIATIDLSRRS